MKKVNQINEIKRELENSFEMVSLGPVRKFLGMEIDRNVERKEIKIHQKPYIDRVFTKFKMKDCKSVATPCEIGLKLDKPEENTCASPYRELIGSLIY